MSLVDKFKEYIVDFLQREPPPLEVPLIDFDRMRYELRPCDVLLVEGRSRISEVIKVITQSPWSHAMLYLGRLHDIENPILRERVKEFYSGDPDEQLIIEGMVGKGTIIVTLESYRGAHIRICRPKGISRQDAQQVIGFAIGRLGMEYAVRHILDLARFLFPWSIMPRRWRSSLFKHNIGTPTKEICSSMLAEAFNSVQFPILPFVTSHKEKGMQLYQRNPRLFTPRDFDYSPYFEIIKYPIFELSEHMVYRNLPWYEQGFVSSYEETEHADKADEAKKSEPEDSEDPEDPEEHNKDNEKSTEKKPKTDEPSNNISPLPTKKQNNNN